jgi:hypothetical protein
VGNAKVISITRSGQNVDTADLFGDTGLSAFVLGNKTSHFLSKCGGTNAMEETIMMEFITH